jgi:hypothetical protein
LGQVLPVLTLPAIPVRKCCNMGADAPLPVCICPKVLNHGCLLPFSRLGQELPVLTLPLCQPPAQRPSSGSSSSSGIDPQLAAWLAASSSQFDALLALLQQQHQARLAWLQEAPAAAAAAVWWPFTQHAQLPQG